MLQSETIEVSPAQTVGQEIAPDAISSFILQEGYAYWLAQRGDRAYPSRADIRPGDIKRVLPNIILVKVLDGGRDYEFRLAGQVVTAAHGFNPTNWKVSELDKHAAGFTAVVMRVYGRVFDSRRPYASRGTLKHIDRGYRGFESLFLPLGPDDRTVDHVLVIAGFSADVDAA